MFLDYRKKLYRWNNKCTIEDFASSFWLVWPFSSPTYTVEISFRCQISSGWSFLSERQKILEHVLLDSFDFFIKSLKKRERGKKKGGWYFWNNNRKEIINPFPLIILFLQDFLSGGFPIWGLHSWAVYHLWTQVLTDTGNHAEDTDGQWGIHTHSHWKLAKKAAITKAKNRRGGKEKSSLCQRASQHRAWCLHTPDKQAGMPDPSELLAPAEPLTTHAASAYADQNSASLLT